MYKPLAGVLAQQKELEMEILSILTALTCFVFGLLGIIISLIELTKFVSATRKARALADTELMSPAVSRRMANAHLGEFLHVLSIAICLIFVSLLGVK